MLYAAALYDYLAYKGDAAFIRGNATQDGLGNAQDLGVLGEFGFKLRFRPQQAGIEGEIADLGLLTEY
jgi:hypothetical protein